MNAQGNSYLSKNINISNDRYESFNDGRNTRLGDRTITSNSIDGKRYYSSLDAEIFFGDTFIDNVVQIQWSMEQATMPLFGYNSYTFDDIAVGARQISGSFMINFTKSGFLYDILKSVQGISRSIFYTDSDLNTDERLKWSSYFEKEHTAAWDKGFNIRIGYGDSSMKKEDTTMQVLYCCQLTGCQQMLSISGDVIGEAYTFIAKDIRYDVDIMPEKIEPKEEDTVVIDPSKPQNNFTLSIESSNIEKIKAKDGSNVGDYYQVNMTYNVYNGVLNKFVVRLKDLDDRAIIPVDIAAEIQHSNNKIRVVIPSKYTIPIDRVFKVSESLNASQYINCDYTYSSDNNPANLQTKTNLKLYLEQKQTQ